MEVVGCEIGIEIFKGIEMEIFEVTSLLINICFRQSLVGIAMKGLACLPACPVLFRYVLMVGSVQGRFCIQCYFKAIVVFWAIVLNA